MWRNYLTVGLRSLMKNRLYSFINILGLAIGLAACLMIMLFIRYELSYDNWVPGNENVYQLQSWYKSRETGREDKLQMTPYIAGKRFEKDFPQVAAEVFVMKTAPVFIKNGEALAAEDFLYVDGNLLDVIKLPLVRGNAAGLTEAGTALMTQSEARRRFGTEDVVGKTMSVISKGVTRDYRIVGVLKELPKNSALKARAVVRIDINSFMAKELQGLSCWGCQFGYSFMRLKPGADVAAMAAQLPAWEKRNIPDEDAGGGMRFNQGDEQDWHLANLRDIHIGPAQAASMTPGNDRSTIATFGIIAALILGMAVVNFTNLSTSRASQRAREVALRKVLGANRKQLISQFLAESMLVTIIAMLVALALVELLMPAFAAFLDADIPVRYTGPDGLGLPVIGLVFVVGLLGGIYPAFFLSRFQPAAVLKANKSAAETPGSGRLRNALVVGQFAVSIGLIICTAVIYAQTIHARSVDPGFDRNNILQLDGLTRYQLLTRGEEIANTMARVEGVDAVGRTGIGVATENSSNTGYIVPGRSELVTVGVYNVDTGFKDAMGLKLVAGRWFDKARPMDDATLPFPADDAAERALAARGANVVINELAARRLGFANPADAVGKTFGAGYVQTQNGVVPSTIIGVVGDARFRSVRVPLEPISFLNTTMGHQYLTLRYHGDPAAVRGRVERAWRSIISDVPFDAKFSEAVVEDLYRADKARATTFAAFAILSVIVGCLGLFGLASFTAERRTKEIGIRKVLGARTRDIVQLLIWQFSKPVLVANLIAWPVAWWLMRDWLNGFDSRIGLGPLPFVVAGGAALVIAAGTVAGHAMRVARANPIHALRYE
ncbi:ABC transporter permease [Polymorphobacter glacialis]|uniref:ABC transporter permease n=1 Tax=Sandarakinorhabdus glacialis TaxID=1614636 RepID=A0A917E4D5_9SPHN|nr:ABC transporter permease [Polymorphobacter glacialis]GGE00418.1 ABC transporter permease [Polymorphobacter glacialis]